MCYGCSSGPAPRDPTLVRPERSQGEVHEATLDS